MHEVKPPSVVVLNPEVEGQGKLAVGQPIACFGEPHQIGNCESERWAPHTVDRCCVVGGATIGAHYGEAECHCGGIKVDGHDLHRLAHPHPIAVAPRLPCPTLLTGRNQMKVARCA